MRKKPKPRTVSWFARFQWYRRWKGGLWWLNHYESPCGRVCWSTWEQTPAKQPARLGRVLKHEDWATLPPPLYGEGRCYGD